MHILQTLLPVCMPAPLNDTQSDCYLQQHCQPHFPMHERLLDCFSDLLGTNGLFTDTSHVCLLPPPHLSSPAKALCPLPAPRRAPLPFIKAGKQWATAPAALPPSLQKGRRKEGNIIRNLWNTLFYWQWDVFSKSALKSRVEAATWR